MKFVGFSRRDLRSSSVFSFGDAKAQVGSKMSLVKRSSMHCNSENHLVSTVRINSCMSKLILGEKNFT
jgi:hypothetical protein